MLFRSTARSTALNSAQLEELRRQDARKALERECRALRRQFTLLDKHHSELRVDHELQCQRLDSLVLQSSALLTLITRPVKAGASVERQCTPMPSFNQNNTGLEEEQTIERAALLRRNAELELQLETVSTQFMRLVADYEDVRGKLEDLKCAVASATTIEELGEWVSL